MDFNNMHLQDIRKNKDNMVISGDNIDEGQQDQPIICSLPHREVSTDRAPTALKIPLTMIAKQNARDRQLVVGKGYGNIGGRKVALMKGGVHSMNISVTTVLK